MLTPNPLLTPEVDASARLETADSVSDCVKTYEFESTLIVAVLFCNLRLVSDLYVKAGGIRADIMTDNFIVPLVGRLK